MKRIHEKIKYINGLGNSVEIAYSFPFFLQEFSGQDGLDSIVHKTKLSGQDGYLVDNLSMQDRPLQIVGVIKGKDKDEVARYRNKLMQVFNPHLDGTLFYEYGEIKKKIKCKVEKAPKFQKKNTSFKRQLFSIELICPDPFWKDIVEKKTEIALWRGAFHFPLVIPQDKGIIMGYREPSLIVNVNNKGQVKSGMRIEFRAKGTVVNPSLFNVHTREFIKINKTMLPGEKITVNTNQGNKKVISYLNGVTTDILNFLDIIGGGKTFLQLDKGDNLLRYNADEGIDNLEIDIYHDDKYLGV